MCAPWMLKKIGDATGTEPTQEQAHQVIESDAGGAAAILLKAANALRDKEPTALAAFLCALRFAPDQIWSRRPTARLNWGQVVETRLRTMLRLLEQCKVRIECWDSSDSTVRFTVRPGVFRISLGAGYWIASWGKSEANQLSIRKQLRSSTAMYVHTAVGKKADSLPAQGLKRQAVLVGSVGYGLLP